MSNNKNKTNNLYHYTCLFHLQTIADAGYLKLTDANLTLQPMTKCVVWLTDDANVTAETKGFYGLGGACVPYEFDKSVVKLTVPRKQQQYKYWNVWKKQQKHDKDWLRRLEEGRKPEKWFISETEISLSDVSRIENTKTGEVYWGNPDFATS
jgi:hypothetical protein